MVHKTKIMLGVKTYVVHHVESEIIRISYINAVLGECPLNMGGAIAGKVKKRFEELRKPC